MQIYKYTDLKYKEWDICFYYVLRLIIFQICTYIVYIIYIIDLIMEHIYMRNPVGKWRIDLKEKNIYIGTCLLAVPDLWQMRPCAS